MKILSNILICIGLFMMIFGTSIAEPMSATVFAVQIFLVLGGLLIAITGGISRLHHD